MTIKRFLAGVLGAALALSLAAPLSAGAASSSFSDISDQNTAVNADILRLMGVVSGTGGGQFDPSGVLTRAQFCTMVVNFMQKGNEVAIHNTRTIFTDVPGSHWARGYVNLAASLTVKDGEQELPLISGVGDGRFQPDAQISLAQAATILIRVLGYTSQQAGAVWPQSYMDLAGSIDLTDGLSGDYNAPLTRAQAAQLFVNALRCKTAEGKAYYTSLGTVTEDTIVLAVNVQTDDGSTGGAIRTTQSEASESYLPANGRGDVYALQGKRGAQVLNDKGEMVTFVPDDSNAITITLSGAAQPSYVKGTNGQQYTISGSTPVYTTTQGEGRNYLEAYTTLYSGTQVTMYSERGKIVAVYSNSGATTIDSDAVVVMGNPTVAMFHNLTGGATDFSITKNRQTISLSQIHPYDVVTYDQINNTLVVSDLRMTCVYGNATPTVNTPESIEDAVGNKFDVLQSAWDTTKDFRLGDTVSLLLTADGKVAGMAAPSADTRSNAVGLVDGGKAQVFLPNGGTLELSGTVSNASSLEGQLVIFSSGKSQLTASRLSENRAPGPFLVDKMKLGDRTVMNSVRIFERVNTSAMAAIDRGDLTMTEIPADKISGYHLNSSGMVDYIVLNNVTGDAYEYGIMVADVKTTGGGWNDETQEEIPETTTTTWSLAQGVGAGIKFASTAGYTGMTGDVVGIIPSKNRNGENMIRTILELDKITHVSPGDFFESQGAPYLSVNGRTYRVANDVECYGQVSGGRYSESGWFIQPDTGDRLAAIKAFSSDLTVYIDPVGEKVRVIVAN